MEFEDLCAALQALEGLEGEADLFARGEEDDALGLLMTLEERIQRVKLVLNIDLHIVMQQLNGGDALKLLTQCLVLSTHVLRVVVIRTAFNTVEIVQANVFVLVTQVHAG